MDAREQIEPIHARQVEVQDHEVRTFLADSVKATMAVGCFAGHFELRILLEQRADGQTHRGVVLDQHDTLFHS